VARVSEQNSLYTKHMAITDCRFFSGYKPCGLSESCDAGCPSLSIPSTRILFIHLEALGAVVRSTALLPAIRRKYPNCHITWVTQKPADQLLKNHPMIDRVLTTTSDDLLALSVLEFDVAFNIDKGLKSAGILKLIKADMIFGFQVDARTGAVLPATPAAGELWEIGLSNYKKFHLNRKPETRLAHEALELGIWMRDPYSLSLGSEEKKEAAVRRAQWTRGEQLVVGINTGCSGVIPYKKLSIEVHRELIERLQTFPQLSLVLLGGSEDTIRNQRIGHGLRVIQSPTELGLRDGLASVEACDVVVTGDSLGMHMAIALKKWTVAWFGPTCAHEIDLYERGEHVQSEASCSPCWKRSCSRSPMCYDLVSIEEIVSAIFNGEAHLRGAIDRFEPEEDDFCEPMEMNF
jgi:heptosyltransferase-2